MNIEVYYKSKIDEMVINHISGPFEIFEAKLIRKIDGNNDNVDIMIKYKKSILLNILNTYLLSEKIKNGNYIIKNNIDYEKLTINIEYEKI